MLLPSSRATLNLLRDCRLEVDTKVKGIEDVNKLVDKMLNCLHWFDMFFPGKKDRIDWKEVGQMRSRLVKMRFGEVQNTNRFIATAQTNGSMLVNFRSMSGDRDKQSLSRWYGKECLVTREKELSARIVAVQREHEARQSSGQYQSITPEEAESVYEVQQPQMSKEAEAKLADFLSGTTDDINELLFTSLGEVEGTDNSETIAPVIKAKDASLASRFSRKSRSEAISSEVIDALEQAHKLESYTPAENAAIELKAEHIVCAEPVEETDLKTDDDNSDNNCRSMAAARSRKAVASKSKLHRK